jgi:hypothetical protein
VTISPKNVIFPERFKRRKADCQGEVRALPAVRLIDQLQRIASGLDAGMSIAEVQHEADAQQAERIIRHWVVQLAANPRRSPEKAAELLGGIAVELTSEVSA